MPLRAHQPVTRHGFRVSVHRRDHLRGLRPGALGGAPPAATTPVERPGAARPGEVTVADVLEVYGPLAELVADRAGSAEPFVVAVTGSVAVGKSAAAAALAAAFGTDTTRAPVSVVCTDGFLYANRELAARGIMERKGFPESFDHDALARFLVAVRDGAAGDARTRVLARDLRRRRRCQPTDRAARRS